jgi:hypothetical protein
MASVRDRRNLTCAYRKSASKFAQKSSVHVDELDFNVYFGDHHDDVTTRSTMYSLQFKFVENF